jgi:glycosidase
LFYGEEIGMGENLEAEGRMAVRTPMQWNAGPNGGFSAAKPSRLRNAVVPGGYGPAHVNAADQRRDEDSLYSFIRMLVQHYRNAPEFGWGAFEVLSQPHDAVLAHSLTWDGRQVVVLHNFGSAPVDVPLHLGDSAGGCALNDLLTGATSTLDAAGSATIELGGYGFSWLRVTPAGEQLEY